MPLLPDANLLEAVQRSTRRAAALVRGEMKRGLTSLASITSVAPLLGFLGTVLAIPNSFPGCGAARAYCMTAVFERLSGALVPAALGLLVAVPALCCYRYLSSEIEAFDLEMENASLQLLNSLTMHLARRPR